MYERSKTVGTFGNWEQMCSRLWVSGKKPYGCVLFQEESVYRRVRAAIAAPRPAHWAQRCAPKKLKNSHPDAAKTCQDLAQTTQWSLFSPHRSVSSSPSPLPAHVASFPSLFRFFVSTHFSHHCCCSLFIALFTLSFFPYDVSHVLYLSIIQIGVHYCLTCWCWKMQTNIA